MEFSRHESWSRLPCPPPGDLPTSPVAPALQVDSLLPSYQRSLSVSLAVVKITISRAAYTINICFLCFSFISEAREAKIKVSAKGTSWGSSGLDSMLPMHVLGEAGEGPKAPSLVRELRSHMLSCTANSS